MIKKQILFLFFLYGPLIFMRIWWTITGSEWLYWFSWSYLAWGIILTGCLLIFAPKIFWELGAFLENTQPKPFPYWSEKHFSFIYLGIIILGLGVGYFYLFIQAFTHNVITQPP